MNRFFYICLALLISCQVFAQPVSPKDTLASPMPDDLQALMTAACLAQYGYLNSSPSALTEAAIIFNSIPTQDLVVLEGSSEKREITPEDAVSYDPVQLIADAKRMAGKDKVLSKYIRKVEKSIGKSKRGAVGGPKKIASYLWGTAGEDFLVQFAGQEKAFVTLTGSNHTDLDLFVYDSKDHLIASDEGGTSNCSVSFTPQKRKGGVYRIRVVNNGRWPNAFILFTN